MNKFATFFGGSKIKSDSQYYEDTVNIGKVLAKFGYTVKNGGYTGLMEAISLGAEQGKGEVIGCLCETFNAKPNIFLSNIESSKDIYDRLRVLIEGSELFIVQKGNSGTLAELFLVFDIIKKIEKSKRPKVILYGEWWDRFNDIFNDLNLSDEGLYKNITSISSLQKYLKKEGNNDQVYDKEYDFDKLDTYFKRYYKETFNKDMKLISSQFIYENLNRKECWIFAFELDDINYLIQIENPILGENATTHLLKQPKAFNLENFNNSPEHYFNKCSSYINLNLPNTPFLNSFK